MLQLFDQFRELKQKLEKSGENLRDSDRLSTYSVPLTSGPPLGPDLPVIAILPRDRIIPPSKKHRRTTRFMTCTIATSSGAKILIPDIRAIQ